MQFKEFFFKIGFFYNYIPISVLLKLSNIKLILPFYHTIGNKNEVLVKHLYTPRSIKHFKEDILFFKKYFTPISIDSFKKDNPSNSPSFLISFDDGLRSFLTKATPVLIKNKISAINFLNTHFIDNQDLFFRYKVSLLIHFLLKKNITSYQKKELKYLFNTNSFHLNWIIHYLKKATQKNNDTINAMAKILDFSFQEFLKKKQPYLTKIEIKELINKGFYFGGHSNSHPYYNTIQIEEQLKETIESVNYVQQEFGIKNNFFAFPFSDNGVFASFFNKIKKHNLITFGTAGIKKDDIENHFQRIPMEYNSIYSAETIIKGELILYLIKKICNKHKVKRATFL